MNVPATGREEAQGGARQRGSPLIGHPDCLAVLLLPVLNVFRLKLNTSRLSTGSESS